MLSKIMFLLITNSNLILNLISLLFTSKKYEQLLQHLYRCPDIQS